MQLNVNLKDCAYPITIQRNALNNIQETIQTNRKVMIITDSGVPQKWIDIVSSQCLDSFIVTIPNGEQSKCFKQYEELLKVEKNKNWWNEDMDIKQLCKYFDKKEITIRKAIKQMCDNGFGQYKFLINNKGVISSKGVEWLCKNVFKQKYLELLEKYKMELTELYIEKGYIYDEFFGRN